MVHEHIVWKQGAPESTARELWDDTVKACTCSSVASAALRCCGFSLMQAATMLHN